MVKTLLIVGAGVEQVPAYELAKKRGFFVVGSDMDPSAPGLAFADHVILASTRDAEGTLVKAQSFHQKHPINGVMTIANDVPYTVARVADALGLSSIDLDAARAVIDKLVMKQRFEDHGVACPWFTQVDTADELQHVLATEPRHRFVLKPVDGRGARGVLLIDNTVDVDWAISESRSWGDCGRLILERFIPGMQLSTESFLLNGKCYTPAIAERNYARLEQFKPNIIEDGGTIPALLDESQLALIDDLLLRGAAALGITEGIVKGDLVIDEQGRPMIIELAARLSGGWFATKQIPEASGVNLVEAVMDHALGNPVQIDDLVPKQQRATAIRYFFPPAGKILAIHGEAELKTVPGLLSYSFYRNVGEMQPTVKTHHDRFGYVLVSADTRDEALQRVEQAINSIEIEVVSG